VYENDEGFQAGDRYSAGLTASSALGLDDWSFGAAAEVHGETAEAWHGIVYEDEGNQGRVDVLAGVSASWRPIDDVALFADVKLPVYSHVVGDQLDYSVVASLGIAGSFDFAPRASWKGADVASLGPRGSAAPLEPVPGKITVFDLWASWCAPCRELDDGLAALARRHPDDLAVRRLDVVDNESEAWLRYMEPGSFDLPHIRVVDDQGVVLYEATAAPEVLLREVERILSR
jgi:thiol-disulfide isomerase/thioredoxin